MKNYLENLDNVLLGIIEKIGREADNKGVKAYVVGGVVRDILLRIKNLDLDVVVEGDAISLAQTLAKIFKTEITVYEKFGTATLSLLNGLCLDLATARREEYAFSGALPMVHTGTLKEDLFRRDFSINAMAVCINRDKFGQMIDFFDGRKDLASKKIRILHKKSFIDDPTRVLRAIRFEQRLSFSLERNTAVLLKRAIAENKIKNVKPARYLTEFRKMLVETHPSRCLVRLHHLKGMQDFGFKKRFSRALIKQIDERVNFLKKNTVYYLKEGFGFLYLMALIEREEDRVVKGLLETFPFYKDERNDLCQLCKVSSVLRELSKTHLTSSQVYQILNGFDERVVLYLRARSKNVVVSRRIDKFIKIDSKVKLRISGDDLKKKIVVSGKEIGKALLHALYQKIDHRLESRQEELEAALLVLGKY